MTTIEETIQLSDEQIEMTLYVRGIANFEIYCYGALRVVYDPATGEVCQITYSTFWYSDNRNRVLWDFSANNNNKESDK